jgi:hypothetical protein
MGFSRPLRSETHAMGQIRGFPPFSQLADRIGAGQILPIGGFYPALTLTGAI